MPGLRAGIKTRNRDEGETNNFNEGRICSVQDVRLFGDRAGMNLFCGTAATNTDYKRRVKHRESKFAVQSDNSRFTLGIKESWKSHSRPLMVELGGQAPFRLIYREFGYGVHDKKGLCIM